MSRNYLGISSLQIQEEENTYMGGVAQTMYEGDQVNETYSGASDRSVPGGRDAMAHIRVSKDIFDFVAKEQVADRTAKVKKIKQSELTANIGLRP